MSLSSVNPSSIFTCFASRSLLASLVLSLLLSRLTLAQQINTVAGGNGQGSAPNQLNATSGVFMDGSGNLYVADANNNRIQKFPPNSTSATAGVTVAGGNGQGSAPNQLYSPQAVFVDGSGNLYVADQLNYRIQKFPPNSTSATAGVTVVVGSAVNQLSYPFGVSMDGSGNIYVADTYNNRIQKFPPNSTSATAGVTVAGGNGQGSAPNQLYSPQAVLVDGSGNLYVADRNNNRIQKFPPNSTSATAGVTLAGGNGQGSAPNQLNYPSSVFMDGSGNLYVDDTYNFRVQKFPPNSTSATAGVTLAGGNGQGFAPNQLIYSYGVYVDGSGNIYVGDNARIQKYSYPPLITSQPVASSTVCAGGTVTAQVSATTVIPGPTFSYQWYSGSGALNGQTSSSLLLTNAQASQSYYVVITSSNGLSTTSAPFTPNVLAPPVASLVASGPLSPATPTVTLTASGGSAYQFGPGATQIGSGPTATVSKAGLYYVKVTNASGCSDVASTSVVQAPLTDLTPLLYARPISLYGSSPVTVVVDVVELNGVASSGLITLKISQQAGLSLSLPPTETTVDGRSVTNSAWQMSGPSSGYYTLTTSQSVSAGSKLSVGLKGNFSAGGSGGGLTVSATVAGGGESNLLNNTDADKLEYFQQ